MDTESDFTDILAFLERCGPEVRGAGLQGLTDAQMVLIERFVRGECTDDERRDLAGFLQLHPAWIRWIADRIEMARQLGSEEIAAGTGDQPASGKRPPDQKVSSNGQISGGGEGA